MVSKHRQQIYASITVLLITRNYFYEIVHLIDSFHLPLSLLGTIRARHRGCDEHEKVVECALTRSGSSITGSVEVRVCQQLSTTTLHAPPRVCTAL